MNLVHEENNKMSDVLLGLEPEEHPLKYHCRFCLKNTKGLPYTTLFTSAGLNHFLREKIEKCIDVKLLKNDKEIANRICITCSKHLDRAYRFAVRYEDSQKKLEEIILVINEKLTKSKYQQPNLDYTQKVKKNSLDEKNCTPFNESNKPCLVIINESNQHNTPMVNNTNKNNGENDERGRIYIPLQIRKSVFDDNIYECRICFCVFTNRKEIHTHMKKHSNVLMNHKELFQNYLDGLCTESDVEDIVSKIVAGTEINSTNLGETFFNQCQLCPAVLATKAQLSKHIQQHCETDNSLMCEVKRTGNKKCLNDKEEEMEQQFSSTKSWKNEVQVKGNTLICKICDKNFHSSKRFDTHVKKHFNSQIPRSKEKQNRVFQCNDCDKVFNSKVSIRKHVTVHLSKTKKQLYACNICGKEYISLVARESHKLKHDPYYEFSCEFCPKKFKLKKLLKEHIRIHTRKTNYSQKHSYSCAVCDVKFTASEDLEFHKEMAHRNEEDIIDCDIDNEEFIKYNNDFTQDSLNDTDELMKIEVEDKDYNEQLSSEDLKNIEEDIMKVEAEDITTVEIEALNMENFCKELLSE